MSVIYTLESLQTLNLVFDTEHRIEQGDVDMVNLRVKLIEKPGNEKPRFGDIIEYTNKWGEYSPNAHINGFDVKEEKLTVRVVSHTPFVFLDENGQGVEFCAGGGLKVFVDAAALTYVGKREKLFKVFGRCNGAGHSGVYFKAEVNVWEYVEPDQQHPGYSTRDWCKQLINATGKAYYGGACTSYGQDISFRNTDELQRWIKTYRAVEFPGYWVNQKAFFHYRKKEMLLSRDEWDTLHLPLDTRIVNGDAQIIHVKVAYDDISHIITEYRFTNNGYLSPRQYSPYERAKGTVLLTP